MVKNQYREYVQKSLLRYMFLVVIFLGVLIFSFLTLHITWYTTNKNKQYNNEIIDILDEEVGNYQRVLLELSSDSNILSALKQDTNDQIETLAQVNRSLYGFANSQLIHSVFKLVNQEEEMIGSNLNKDNQTIFLNSTLFQTMKTKMDKEPERIFMSASRLNYSYGQNGALIIGKCVVDGDKVVGYLFFDLLDDQIYEFVSQYPLDEVIITDDYNNLIFSIGRQGQDSKGKYPIGRFWADQKQGDRIELNEREYKSQKGELKNSELILYTLVSTKFPINLFWYALLFLALAVILILVMLKPLTVHITDKNLYALEELRKSVEELGKGNMEYSLQPQVFDEFSELNEIFINMFTQREDLERRNSELIERKRVMEIKQLELQINPHFLFNILETIRYQIVIDANKASEMIIALAEIMRYSISYGSKTVPLEKDIEYINDYLLLQKMRFNRRLTYSIEIPDELLEYMIPKLVLQPIVENSLSHGMKDLESIHVKISAFIEGEELILNVEDNGVGIEANRLEELRKELEKEDIYREHIGLYNSHRVVRLIYGPRYGLKINSIFGAGTLVSIQLPIVKEDEDVQGVDS